MYVCKCISIDRYTVCHQSIASTRPMVSYHCPDIADFEGAKSKVSVLVSAAESTENLSRMDPMWNPWL